MRWVRLESRLKQRQGDRTASGLSSAIWIAMLPPKVTDNVGGKGIQFAEETYAVDRLLRDGTERSPKMLPAYPRRAYRISR